MRHPPHLHELEDRSQQGGQEWLEWLKVLDLLHKVADSDDRVDPHGELRVGQAGHGLRGDGACRARIFTH